jgi:hypothetical protein
LVPIAVELPAVCWRVRVVPPTCETYAYQPVAPVAVGGESIVRVEVDPVVVTDVAGDGSVSPLALT